MSHLLDSNPAIDHFRKGLASKVTARLLAAPPQSVFLCSPVLGELYFGAENGDPKFRATNIAMIARIRQQLLSLPFDDPAAEEYGLIRAYLAKAGTPIGPNDMMIAVVAEVNNLTLVTHNTTEFGRVPGLSLEGWQ